MSSIRQYIKYLFIFAHPDDEVYSCGLMHQLIKDGKIVKAAFITSGDAGVNSGSRIGELRASLAAIGVQEADTILMGIPEKEALTSFSAILKALQDIVADISPDCVIGMDFEGGHEVHDSASFLASRAVTGLTTPHYVFPVYHMQDGHREAAAFAPGRKTTDTVKLHAEDVSVKIKVLEAHRGQIGHFLHLQRQSPEYFQRLFSREVFREIAEPIDYTTRPANEIGYESHRNGFKFEDFKHAVEEAV